MSSARALFASTLVVSLALSQGPPSNGPAAADLRYHALRGAAVVVKPGQRIENATLVIKDGRVVSCSAGAAPPDGARVHDCTGLTIYPGLIEPFLAIDVPAPDADAPNVHWHPSVLSQRDPLAADGASKQDRELLRSLGFCAAAIAPIGGNFKGTGAVVLLDEPTTGHKAQVVRAESYHLCSLSMRFGSHPSSEMGAISLVRQVLADANWFASSEAVLTADRSASGQRPSANAALAMLSSRRTLPLMFDCDDELQILRAARIAAEFDRPMVAIGSGMEFRRAQAIALAKVPVIVPVHFPEAPDVATIGKQQRVSLRQLQTWEQAPTNLRRLLDEGVKVALTTARLQDKKDFRTNLADALAFDIDRDQALAALTTTPAEILGCAQDLGTLENGRIANLVVVDGDLFDPKARIDAVFVAGNRHEIEAKKAKGLDGTWTLTVQLDPKVEVALAIDNGAIKATIGDRNPKVTNAAVTNERVEFAITDEALGTGATWVRARTSTDASLTGTAHAATGTYAAAAVRSKPAGDEQKGGKSDKDAPEEPTETGEKKDDAADRPVIAPLATPLGGYGVLAQPPARDVVLQNATLWTSGEQGTIPLGALWVKAGRIAYAGPREGLPPDASKAETIDATGKHITPGVIDCHSHTGISRGVNEGGEAVTAEVRVQDVVDPDDVNWYRQLAGGVTAVNQLHGSANAIGGQSNTVKLRWGSSHPDAMWFHGSVPGIKFALGENPRGANGGGNGRYPSTRMGVEALIRDRFLVAQDYARRVASYEALPPRDRARTLPPRRDLELEAIAEILAGKRRVHCHSYRQDEIFMLCAMAKEFGFRIGTFQHVLEGYKVAEAIREQAIGASAFSDWWGYKFEVYDAIPDNGAILREVGVCVSFNSDSNEHARRLNTEAGKAVKYGGVPPAEALKFVTINPAIQLGIDAQVGSLERGKDADFAIWSDDPLSYAAVCESTWVDGAERFSLARDRELRATIKIDRERLLRKALAAGGKKGKTAKNDERDAYWAAEDLTASYCCRDCEGVR